MRILILGAGEVGFHLARQLSDEGHDVVVIEQDRERVRAIEDAMDAMVIHGNGASLRVLEDANVRRTDLLLAVTSVDEINLMACLSASQYDVRVKIARVSKPDYFENHGVLPPERMGVDLMINPERECALEVFQLLQSAAVTEVAQFEGGLVQLVGFWVQPGSPIAGRTLAELGREYRRNRYLVAALVRDGETRIPTGNDEVRAGDHIFVIGEPAHLPDILPLAGHQNYRLSRVMIAGGSREACLLAQMLAETDVTCTLLETDRERAAWLAEQLPSALVLHGDATDLELLEMEGAGESDGFVAFTGSDETNLLSCLLAKNLGTRKVVALIDRMNYIPLVSRVGVDAAVSPRRSTVNAILSYVRRGSVLSVASLRGAAAEVIEFDIPAHYRDAGLPLSDAQVPEGSLVGAIVRGSRVIIPSGNDTIRVGDRVIVFTLPGAIAAVEKVFG